MTVTSYEIPQSAQEIRVRDEYGPLSFVGEKVADLSWNYDAAYERGHTRWTDLTLYRVWQQDSEYDYVVQVVGRSVLYHRLNGSCHQGVSIPVSRLRQDVGRYEALEPCTRPGCQPADLEDLNDSDSVSVEEDLFSLYKCKNAEEVVDTMYARSGRARSGLSMKLLQAASRVDDGIELAMSRTRRL
jgi:hypothetical protein